MVCVVSSHGKPVESIRPGRRHAPPARSAAEIRRERDILLRDLAALGWSHREIATVSSLSVRQVKRRLAAMARRARRAE